MARWIRVRRQIVQFILCLLSRLCPVSIIYGIYFVCINFIHTRNSSSFTFCFLQHKCGDGKQTMYKLKMRNHENAIALSMFYFFLPLPQSELLARWCFQNRAMPLQHSHIIFTRWKLGAKTISRVLLINTSIIYRIMDFLTSDTLIEQYKAKE